MYFLFLPDFSLIEIIHLSAYDKGSYLGGLPHYLALAIHFADKLRRGGGIRERGSSRAARKLAVFGFGHVLEFNLDLEKISGRSITASSPT